MRGQRALHDGRGGGASMRRSVWPAQLRRQQEVRDASPPADVRVQVWICGERERRAAVRARSTGVCARRGLLFGPGVPRFPVSGSVRRSADGRPAAAARLCDGQVVPGARPQAGVHLHEGLQSVGVDLSARQRLPGGAGVPQLSVCGSVRERLVCGQLAVHGREPSAGVPDVSGRLCGGCPNGMSKR